MANTESQIYSMAVQWDTKAAVMESYDADSKSVGASAWLFPRKEVAIEDIPGRGQPATTT